jgi:hypothetical protein
MVDSANPRGAPEAPSGADRARQFLRDIRDTVARHPVASQGSAIRLHERREAGMTVLRLSGHLDRMPVELHVRVSDRDPRRPRLEYSPLLERLRSGHVMALGASVFTAAHDQAFRTHYPDSEPWLQTLRMAIEQSFAALSRGRLH